MANEQEFQDSLKPEELASFSQKVEKGEGLDQTEAERLIKNLPSLKKSIDGLYSRAKTAEEEREKFKGEFAEYKKLHPEATPPPPEPPKPGDDKRKLDAREYAKALNAGYSDEEIDYVESVMVATGKSFKDVIELPYVKLGIEAARQKAKSEQTTPPPSDRISTPGKPEKPKGKSFEEWKREKTEKK